MVNGQAEQKNVVKRLWEAIKGELTKTVATSIVTGVVGGIVAAAIFIWAYLANVPGDWGLVPTGAVVSFALEAGCPPGWENYDKAHGRFIIGAATDTDIKGMPSEYAGDEDGAKLKPRDFEKPGGRQEVTLTTATIPSHTHVVGEIAVGLTDLQLRDPTMTEKKTYSYAFSPNSIKDIPAKPFNSTKDSLGGKPHDNIPPYVALRFCRKN